MIALRETWLSHLALRRGRIADAEAHGRTGADLSAMVGSSPVVVGMRAHLADALIARDEIDAAEQVLDFADAAATVPGGVAWTMALEVARHSDSPKGAPKRRSSTFMQRGNARQHGWLAIQPPAHGVRRLPWRC
jgi:hypothetical protein